MRIFVQPPSNWRLLQNRTSVCGFDRVTRNGGMGVWCDRKIVEFKRFTASMTNEWKARKLDEWNSAQCGSALWAEAIRQGWKVQLSVTAADGGQAAFAAKC
jgi:hypothetical protein